MFILPGIVSLMSGDASSMEEKVMLWARLWAALIAQNASPA
jgi:hypothetical protein